MLGCLSWVDSSHFVAKCDNILKQYILWKVISFFQYPNGDAHLTPFYKGNNLKFFFLQLYWFLCTNATMIMSKSWNINHVIEMLNVFHANMTIFLWRFFIYVKYFLKIVNYKWCVFYWIPRFNFKQIILKPRLIEGQPNTFGARHKCKM